MQPMLSLVAPEPGVVLLNGRFAGEGGPDAPLLFPVCPWGPLYLTFLPLRSGFLPLSLRLTFSAGRLLAADLPPGAYAIGWPGSVTEVELVPPWPGPEIRQRAEAEGVAYALVEGAEPWLEAGGARLRLPDGARLPELTRRDGLLLFSGAAAGGARYLAAVPEAGAGSPTLLRGTRIDVDGALIHVVAPRGDVVGHAALETWRVRDGALALERAEPGWAEGAPRWPRTAGETALALVEAWLLGLEGEAETWLAPQLAGTGILAALLAGTEGATPLRYALADGRPAVGLLRREAKNVGRVEPLYYRAVPVAGSQGPWQIAALER